MERRVQQNGSLADGYSGRPVLEIAHAVAGRDHPGVRAGGGGVLVAPADAGRVITLQPALYASQRSCNQQAATLLALSSPSPRPLLAHSSPLSRLD